MDGFGMLLGFVTGLALFLYGMHVLGEGLEKMSGGKLESILERLTSTPLKGILLGTAVTAIIQSSSATTVMVVGFVNSGIMKLEQAVGIIIGANMGTTITSWILSLSGLKGDSFFIQLLKPANFSPFLAMIGVALLLVCKKEKKRNVGIILTGFGVLMIGMDTMSAATEGLKNVPAFGELMIKFSNPILGLLVGLILTAIIQSSSASVGILQALCSTGKVLIGTSVPIVIGQNIGTCVTAMLSSIGAKKNARRAAVIHLVYNVISAIIFMILFYVLDAIIDFKFLGNTATGVQVAIIHTLFNVFKMATLAPFSQQLVKMSRILVKGEDEEENVQDTHEIPELDVRFLDKPALAMEHCKNVAVKMAHISREALVTSMSLINEFTIEKYDDVIDKENIVDIYEDQLASYMIKVSSHDLSEADSKHMNLLLHLIGDFERISDYAVNIAQSAKKMKKKEMEFSKKAVAELEVFGDLIMDILNTSIEAFENNDENLATCVEPMEEVADKLNKEIKKRHVKRLRKGKCTVDMGFILSDITTGYERIADHCSNVAVGIIQISEDGYESHDYIENLDKGENTEFYKKYVSYKEKYALS